MKSHQMKLVLAAVLTLHLSGLAFGGTILFTPAPVASGPGLGYAAVAVVVTTQSNNDNVPGNAIDANFVVPQKRFDTPNYIDIQFTVAPSDGTTEYQFLEFVDNNTGTPWSSLRMQLGFGTGANFVLSALGDGLDFDFPTYDTPPTSGAFSTVLHPDEDQLVFTGGTHAGGAQPYNFRVDVPELAGRASPTFTLREIPVVVPEPSTLVLAMVALLGLAAYRRHN